MKSIKKLLILSLIILICISIFSGCAKSGASSEFKYDKDITVVARDAASGTRGAFHELMKIKVKEGDRETDKLVTGRWSLMEQIR